MLLTVLWMNEISASGQATIVKFRMFAYLGQLFVPLNQFLQFLPRRPKNAFWYYPEILLLGALEIEIAKSDPGVQITSPDMTVCKI